MGEGWRRQGETARRHRTVKNRAASARKREAQITTQIPCIFLCRSSASLQSACFSSPHLHLLPGPRRWTSVPGQLQHPGPAANPSCITAVHTAVRLILFVPRSGFATDFPPEAEPGLRVERREGQGAPGVGWGGHARKESSQGGGNCQASHTQVTGA